jgi:hypothetical protein
MPAHPARLPAATRGAIAAVLATALIVFSGLAQATSCPASTTCYSIITVTTRPGITVPLMITDNSNNAAVATLILFTGGTGVLGLSNGSWGTSQTQLMTHDTDSNSNFLVRQRNNFAVQGFNIILVDVPSDQDAVAGYTPNPSFRKSSKHQTDIAKVIAYARTTFSVPVWLVGTSRGSTSAAKGALIATQRPMLTGPDGFVLTSTIVNDDPDNVLDMPLKDIALVAMMVADFGDICSLTPYTGVFEIARHLQASPDFRGKVVTNTTDPVDPSDDCNASGYHGFSNAEGKVVSPIGAWIIGHLPTP